MTEESINTTGGSMDTINGHEQRVEPQALYLGRLSDFKIGNPNGIPSDLEDASAEELEEYAEKAKQALEVVTDEEHYTCIDGRKRLRNADGSQPEVRHSQVGGTGASYGVARNAGASIIDTLHGEPLSRKIDIVEKDVEAKTGVKRSAHLGVCGGVAGEVTDDENIARNPSILNVSEVLVGLPQIQAFTGIAYNQELGDSVRESASETAKELQELNWDGAKYVAGVENDEPRGVEDLEVDDSKFHGHKERALWIVVSEDKNIGPERLEELGLGEAFVWSIKGSRDMARALAGQRGQEGATQALIANFAKHVAVADRLPKNTTPVFLMVAL